MMKVMMTGILGKGETQVSTVHRRKPRKHKGGQVELGEEKESPS